MARAGAVSVARMEALADSGKTHSTGVHFFGIAHRRSVVSQAAISSRASKRVTGATMDPLPCTFDGTIDF